MVFGVIFIQQNVDFQGKFRPVPSTMRDLIRNLFDMAPGPLSSTGDNLASVVKDSESPFNSKIITLENPPPDSGYLEKPDSYENSYSISNSMEIESTNHLANNSPTKEEYSDYIKRLKRVIEKINSALDSSSNKEIYIQ